MASQSIDIQGQINLPNSSSNVFVQLTETRPERVYYRINLIDAHLNTIHVVPEGVYAIPIKHDLQRSANELKGYQMACVGIVGFAVAGSWDLDCQFLVDGSVVGKLGPGTLNGTQGDMCMFRFRATFA
jgi:hypothetical protein